MGTGNWKPHRTEEEKEELIRTGKLCPYCGEHSEYISSTVIYAKDYGMVYACLPCEAWVGTHKGRPTEAYGRLADKELRIWKGRAHASFDKLWRRKMQRGVSKYKARTKAYKWLGKEMGLHPDHTHIGMFNIEQCKQVVEICKPYLL